MIGQMPISPSCPSTRSCRAPSRHVLAVALLLATPALAEPQVYRLTPQQREAAIEAGAAGGESAALVPAPIDTPLTSHLPAGSLYADDEAHPDRRPHGEFGVVAGSGGTAGFYGTTIVPLGDNGTLGLSFAYGTGRGFYGPYGGYGAGYDGFGGYGLYPGHIGPGFPLGLVPGPRGRTPAR